MEEVTVIESGDGESATVERVPELMDVAGAGEDEKEPDDTEKSEEDKNES